MNAQPFGELMGMLISATGANFDAPAIEAWRLLLSDIPDDALRAGMLRAANECEKFPSVALVRRFASEARYGVEAGHGEAFDKVLETVRRIGGCIGCQPKCDACREDLAKSHLGEIAWRAVNALGGWKAICESEVKNRGTLRAQFRDAYEEIAERVTEHRRLPPKLRPKLNGAAVDEPAPPRPRPALPAPVQPTQEQIDKAKLLPMFRSPEEVKPEISEEEFQRRRAEQVAAAEALIERKGSNGASERSLQRPELQGVPVLDGEPERDSEADEAGEA